MTVPLVSNIPNLSRTPFGVRDFHSTPQLSNATHEMVVIKSVVCYTTYIGGERVMLKIRKRTAILAIILLLIVLLVIWIAWGNEALELNTYRIESDKIPSAFDGFRIAQVSDLHNTEIGEDNEKLLSMLKGATPDIIVITGDMIDCRKTNIEVALDFAEEAVKIAPCYYISGNHEAYVDEYEMFKSSLTELGVTVLDDAKTEIELSGEKITLIGVGDPSFSWTDNETLIKEKLDNLLSEDDGYTILLSHRPELFEIYVEKGIDLVFTGHAHGGQVVIPFIGGVAAPNQGLFPKYDTGIYTDGDTNMLVSRGVGNSLFPFRVNNRPEVILVELATK